MGQLLSYAKVEDFDRFWATFTSRGAEQRRKFGSRGARVFRSEDDPHEVWVLFDWEDTERYQEFLNDSTTQEIFNEAGLQGPPQGRRVREVGTVES